MILHSPWWLLALLLVPLAWWPWLDPRRRPAIRFSDLSRLKAQPAGWGVRARLLLPLLRTTALVSLVVALARPQRGNEQTRIFSEGIAIQLVCDVSGSMNGMDFELDGKAVTRMEAVKRTAADFVRGGTRDLPGRPNDLIGLITFARYADSACPLTLDHANLLSILERTRAKSDIEDQRRLRDIQTEYRRRKFAGATPDELRELETQFRLIAEEDGTAIGDAIGLGLERLDQATKARAASGKEAIQGRVMILITDGKQTVPDSLDPVEAARIAKPLGIKIHTILVGRENNVPVARLGITGEVEYVAANFDIDVDVLQKVAEVTDGRSFRANDTDALREIYREIDRLERTKTDERRYMEYTEKSGPWLWAAFACMAFELLAAQTLLRKIP